jgi:hypothetical protein
LTTFWTYIFILYAQSSHAEIDFLTTLLSRLLKLTFLTKPLSTMLKLAFLTMPPINPPNPVATGLQTMTENYFENALAMKQVTVSQCRSHGVSHFFNSPNVKKK